MARHSGWALATDSGDLNDSARGALRTYFLIAQYEPFRKRPTEQNELNLEARAIARRGVSVARDGGTHEEVNPPHGSSIAGRTTSGGNR